MRITNDFLIAMSAFKKLKNSLSKIQIFTIFHSHGDKTAVTLCFQKMFCRLIMHLQLLNFHSMWDEGRAFTNFPSITSVLYKKNKDKISFTFKGQQISNYHKV